MWIPYNANPIGKERIDCTIRALSLATGLDWDDVYWGVVLVGFELKQMPSDNQVWGEYLRRMGFRRRSLEREDWYTVRDFCQDHPEGLYVLAISGHLVTVVNGNYYDFWDSGNEIPVFIWEAKT